MIVPHRYSTVKRSTGHDDVDICGRTVSIVMDRFVFDGQHGSITIFLILYTILYNEATIIYCGGSLLTPFCV